MTSPCRFISVLPLVLLTFSPLQSALWAGEVTSFSPQGLSRGVRQVRAQFSAPMVPFGDPAVGEPFEISCPATGQGRWLDSVNWVFDFDEQLSAGIRCEFAVKEGLTTLDGDEIGGRRHFSFNTGGPAVLRTTPWEGATAIDENQVFILWLDGQVSAQSVEQGVYLVVEGLASEVGVRIVEGEERNSLLQTQYIDGWNHDHLLLIRPRQTLPPSSRVRLIWSGDVESPEGVSSPQDQVIEFRTRSSFLASFSCSRENAERHCIPLLPMRLSFSSAVPVGQLEGAQLVGPEGEIRLPLPPGDDPFTTTLTFEGPFPPRTEYHLEIPSGIRDDADRPLLNEGRFPLKVATDDYPPLAKFAAPFGIIEALDGATLPVTVRNIEADLEVGQLDLSELSGEVYRVSPDDFRSLLGWLRKVTTPYWDRRDTSIFAESGVRPEPLQVPRVGGERSFEVLGIPFERPGLYVVELRSEILGASLLQKPGPMFVSAAALVTNLGVHFKWGMENSLVWVTSLRDSRPVADAAIEVRDCEGRVYFQGRTGVDGVAVFEELPDRNEVPRCEWNDFGNGLFVTARKGDDMGLVSSNWDEGIESWRFGLYGMGFGDSLQTHTIFDRTLFRAGETVSMKHVLRRRTLSGFGRVEGGSRPDKAVVRHEGSDETVELPLSWNSRGEAASIWTIPRSAKLGTYSVGLERDGMFLQGGSFRVEEFRVPMMRGVIQPPESPQILPERMPIQVAVEYLSGGPAARLPMVFRHQFQRSAIPAFAEWEGFQFGGERVKEGLVRSGEEEEQISREIERTELRLDELGGAAVSVEVPSDLEGPSSVYAEMEYRDPNGVIQTVSTTVPVWSSGLLAGISAESRRMRADEIQFKIIVIDLKGRPVPGVRVDGTLFRRKYYSHRKRLVGGFYAYEHYRETRRLGTGCAGTSDEEGLVACAIASPESGSMIFQVTGQDGEGRPFLSTQDFYAEGDDDSWYPAEDSDRIDLIPEKKRYQPGEVARFEVRSPFQTSTALVTVEREGIARHFVTSVQGNQGTIEVAIEDADSPNVFVSALLVRGRIGGIPPTAFVDLAKPAFKLGLTEIEVGWLPHQLTVQVEPGKEVYRVREKAQVRLQVSCTDGTPLPAGTELAVSVVDEGLLDLWPNQSWEILEAMMGRRGLDVQTSTAQMQVVGKRHFGLKALPHGGGGGKQTTRELFDTLLYWNGSVPVDGNGRATIEFPMNDSVTAFRIAAVALAGLDRFGSGSATIRSSQELMIFSGIPPVVRSGDRFEAEFTVRNATTQPVAATVNLEVTELELERSSALELEPGEADVIRFSVQVPADIGVNRLTHILTAVTSDFRDEIRVEQEVSPSVTSRVIQATFGRLEEEGFELSTQLPEAALPGSGVFNIELRPSLIGSLDGVTRYMQGYSYSCLEQLLSRAVTLDDRVRWDQLTARLSVYMDEDGLFRYFPGGGSRGSDTLTSYILALAHETGWGLPEPILEQALTGLEGIVEGRVIRSSSLNRTDLTLRKLDAIESLSRYGRAHPSMFSSIQIAPDLWPTSAVLAYLNACRRLGELMPPEAGRRAEEVLRARLTYQGTTAQFVSERTDALHWLMVTPELNLARLILALLEHRTWHEDLTRLAQGFVARQQNGHWGLTTANAWGTLALRKFSQAEESETVGGASFAELGSEQARHDWDETSDGGSIRLPWPAGSSTLLAGHEGSGRPWIFARAEAVLPGKVVDSGYRIEKTMTAVEQKTPGHWSVGDIARVRLEVTALSGQSWVVIDDPIPAGALILGGGLGGGSQLALQGERREDWWASFEERSFRSYRVYHSFLPEGSYTLEYTVRFNTPGSFQLPVTRVEALYHPEVFGEWANPTFEVD